MVRVERVWRRYAPATDDRAAVIDDAGREGDRNRVSYAWQILSQAKAQLDEERVGSRAGLPVVELVGDFEHGRRSDPVIDAQGQAAARVLRRERSSGTVITSKRAMYSMFRIILF